MEDSGCYCSWSGYLNEITWCFNCQGPDTWVDKMNLDCVWILLFALHCTCFTKRTNARPEDGSNFSVQTFHINRKSYEINGLGVFFKKCVFICDRVYVSDRRIKHSWINQRNSVWVPKWPPIMKFLDPPLGTNRYGLGRRIGMDRCVTPGTRIKFMFH